MRRLRPSSPAIERQLQKKEPKQLKRPGRAQKCTGRARPGRVGLAFRPRRDIAHTTTLAGGLLHVGTVAISGRSQGRGQMNPLIGIAAGVVPDIIKLIAGDKTGQLADQVGKAVADTVGTTNAGEAQTKLATNPAAQVALRQKLAELALEARRLRTRKPTSNDTIRVSNTRARAQRAPGVGHDEYDDRLDGADDLLPRDRRFLHFLVCACLAVLVGAEPAVRTTLSFRSSIS